MYRDTIQNRHALDNYDKPMHTAFFISDGTALSAETLGRSVLSQFDSVPFKTFVIPYVDSLEKAEEAVIQIQKAYEDDGLLPFVFDTIIDDNIREKINSVKSCNLDIYEGLIGRIADEIGVEPDADSGHSHDNLDSETYKSRIDAVHFALDNDDGGRTRQYDNADLILVGVSRSGKTPTSLYLAMQFGIRVANYPLTEEDLGYGAYDLPKCLQAHKNKLFGLTINIDRLVKIRTERRADSRYASYRQCEQELKSIQNIYNFQKIPSLDISEMSIEEIATRILQMTDLKRRIG